MFAQICKCSRFASSVVLFAAFAFGACQSGEAPAPSARPSAAVGVVAPIVNGQTETGWPGVGALTFKYGSRYGGAYCTAELIAPQWVLTAGHCTTGSELTDQGITAANTRFYVGPDARPVAGGGAPTNGAFYQADAAIPHPLYKPDSNSSQHDIGLVHLAQPVPDTVPIYPLASMDLADFVTAHAPLEVFVVGFGAVEGINESGSGLKRSTHVAVTAVQSQYYTSDFVDTGTCFGDSGGPDFATLDDGTAVIVGVTSAGAGCPLYNPNCDPCQTVTLSTRVDAHLDWINGQIQGPAPTCHTAPSMCRCTEACQTDGTCDDTQCHVDDCVTAYQCASGCGSGDATCRANCVGAATHDAQTLVTTLLTCADEKCANVTGSQQHRQCVRNNCTYELNGCFGYGPTAAGDQNCDQVYDCEAACADNDCATECLNHGTPTAQSQVSDLQRCFWMRCGDQSGDAFTSCVHEYCEDQINACYLPGTASCTDIKGCFIMCDPDDSSCPNDCWRTGSAEARTQWETLRACEKASCAKAVGDAVDECALGVCPNALLTCMPGTRFHPGCPVTGGECPQGTACVQGSDGTTSCIASAGKQLDAKCDATSASYQCADGLTCRDGKCVPACVDADGDHVCAADDCDDHDANVHPGATEVCGDGRDNDCDGVTDNGCAEPVAEAERIADPAPAAEPSSGVIARGGGCAGGGDVGVFGGLIALLIVLRVRSKRSAN